MDHLQFVLDVPKKQIGGRQRVALLRRQKLFSRKRLQRTEGAAVQQCRVLLASQHLDRLCEKLDFPNAAGAELDVAMLVPPIGHLRIDHFFDRADILDDGHGACQTGFAGALIPKQTA